MKLKVLGSSSAGNCYILENNDEALIIEAGIEPKYVKRALGFNISKAKGVLLTHEHGDHSKYMGHLMAIGLNIYASNGTHNSFIGTGWHRRHILKFEEPIDIGGFTVVSFNTYHDTAEPIGFIIRHNDFGGLLFCTDSKKLPYKFEGLDHVMVEANYDFNLIPKSAVRDRTFQNHMEIGTTIDFLQNNNLESVKNIVLLHLSNSNSNELVFKQRVREVAPNCIISIAKEGLELELSNEPF